MNAILYWVSGIILLIGVAWALNKIDKMINNLEKRVKRLEKKVKK